MFPTELRVIIVYKLFCPQLGSTFRAYKDTSTGKQTAPVNSYESKGEHWLSSPGKVRCTGY